MQIKIFYLIGNAEAALIKTLTVCITFLFQMRSRWNGMNHQQTNRH